MEHNSIAANLIWHESQVMSSFWLERKSIGNVCPLQVYCGSCSSC